MLGRYHIRGFVMFGILLLTSGCASQKQLRTQWEHESDMYYGQYYQAQSPQAAVVALNNYLRFIDNFERQKVVGPRYDLARALPEERMSIIYEQLGDRRTSQIFMERAVDDAEQDEYVEKGQTKRAVEAGLRQMIEKIDGWNTIGWQRKKPTTALKPNAP